MLIDAIILGLGAALAGLVGSIGRSLAKPWMRPPLRMAGLGGLDLGLGLLAWASFLALVLLACLPAGHLPGILPVLAAALPLRAGAILRRLDRLDLGDLVRLKAAAVLALTACALAELQRGLGEARGGLVEAFLPCFIGGLAVAALVVAQARLSRRVRPRRVAAARRA